MKLTSLVLVMVFVSIKLTHELEETKQVANNDGKQRAKTNVDDSVTKRRNNFGGGLLKNYHRQTTPAASMTRERVNEKSILLGKLSQIGRTREDRRKPAMQIRRRKSEDGMTIDIDEIYDDDDSVKSQPVRNEQVEFKFDPSSIRHVEVASSKVKDDQLKNTRAYNQMKSIYNSLKDGQKVFADDEINTVRLVPSFKDASKKLNLVFNLSMLSNTERIIKAELYVNRKFIKQKLMLNLNYLFYKDANLTANTAAQIDLSNMRLSRATAANNWHFFNIVDSLRSYVNLRNGRNQPDQQLLLIVEAKFRFKKFNFNAALNPYLIIYTSEDESKMRNFFQSRLPNELSHEERESTPPGVVTSTSTTTTSPTMNKQAPTTEQTNKFSYYANKDSSIMIVEELPVVQSKTVQELMKLKKANMSSSSAAKYLLNYLPKVEDKLDEYVFINQAKKIKRRAVMSPSFDDLNDDLKNGDEENNDENLLLPWNENAWNLDENATDLIRAQESKCQTQPIKIDFQDIGFSTWIIEPKSFDSNYCSGKCNFAQNEKTTFTNYGTLQSILNAFDFNVKSRPPELCCTPSLTHTLPIFYLDSNSIDLVVKLLPDMIVSECACR